ncbi:ABC transporter substrate-binding protein (plasmid) [Azospirillum baldaniorum]|uniref:Periplasmic binding proteins and sugar binding domain of the LacI family n=1 Tax=Azospirillum baldaniorum TaxID=1064539 RepID=A0A9P1JZF1_9PROT|nr:substrate-binding domain-containing protein [Azospirillum baldaniorum]TWA78190.1 monosaccharide ABC transporter substrate-binding protein (CUT2 family) [Azospirillum brasilense]AWJ92775.1 ABC transporter substrate-binding protein [Azospirillum baldaniorum]NUB04990.1 substrate-binding domain-containing protein [Azospirillum baldaniorum]TWA63639.1 monosaccharide ABC transporter substrate-binding protein (CUT2 family) [Azospirillum baldaniorum]CCD02688.1 putative Periplasmic binding proteins a
MTFRFGLAAALAAGLMVAPVTGWAQQKIKMGVSIPAATHGWAGGLNWHAQQAEKRLEKQYPNLDVVIVTARDVGRQANDLEDLVSVQRIDALVILPFESAPMTDPVRAVKQAGKFVTVVDRGLTDPSIQDLYVAGNNPQMGEVSARFMKEKMGGKGDIVVLRGIPTVIDNQRVDAFMKEIEGTQIKVLGMQYANWNRDDGFKVMQDFLSRFPKIDAVWAQDDDIALGVIEAVKQAGREKEMFILGGAGMKDMIKRVMDKDVLVPADVLYPPAMIAEAMEITAKHLVEKAPIQKEYIIEATLVTPENAAKYYYPDSPF